MPDTRKRVLVVDDATLVRLFYRKTLEAAGFEVVEALNGIEALESLTADSADLLVVDVNMPRMDGMTLLKEIRRKAAPLSSLPALVTSTESEASELDAARRAGANFYLMKPVNPDELVEFCSLLCGRRD